MADVLLGLGLLGQPLLAATLLPRLLELVGVRVAAGREGRGRGSEVVFVASPGLEGVLPAGPPLQVVGRRLSSSPEDAPGEHTL